MARLRASAIHFWLVPPISLAEDYFLCEGCRRNVANLGEQADKWPVLSLGQLEIGRNTYILVFFAKQVEIPQ